MAEGQYQASFSLLEEATQGPDFRIFEAHLHAIQLLLSSYKDPQYADTQEEFLQPLQKHAKSLEQHAFRKPELFPVQTFSLLVQTYEALYFINGKPAHLENAERIITKAIAFNPHYAEFFYQAGEIKLLQGKSEVGISFFAKARNLEQDIIIFHDRLEQSLREIGQDDKQIEVTKKALLL